jgi:L-seryl-tRNA(Ser) seleniumtransferase
MQAPAGRDRTPDDSSSPALPPTPASLRQVPSVDELLRHATALESAASLPRASLLRAVRQTLAEVREQARVGGDVPDLGVLAARALALAEAAGQFRLRPVINATGVIVNTNLGRAPLSAAALEAMEAVARGYSNLEYDLDTGERGSRQAHVRDLLCQVTGAEEALVVNNNAAAMLIVLSALAAGREVIVSRGELVEIGGGFRVPDVMRQGGARLVEVGTTNRTRVADYAAAIGSETAALLAVHPSNFRIVGFTESPSRAALAQLAHAQQLPLVEDLGSGCLLATERWGLAHEPTPMESLAAGADIVCFSGDKLLGGPQAGIIVGRAEVLKRLARHPLMRAMRIDKMTLAALEATLRHYRDGTAERDVPVWRMIATPIEELRRRAERWAERARELGAKASVVDGESTIGGGSLPGETLPTALCALETAEPGAEIGALAQRLRAGHPPVVGRVSRAHLLLDPRTVAPDEDESLLHVLAAALAPGKRA